MAFHLKIDESVERGLRRIAVEQLERGLRAKHDPHASVAVPHAIRKRCKKVRGLLRLVRGSFADYRVEQRALRDTARKLAAVRESAAHLEALQRLCSRDRERYQGPDFELARTWLESRRDAALRTNEEHECIEKARAMLTAQRERAGDWQLQAGGFEAIADGLVRTYRGARRALTESSEEPSAHNLHELRKHVKYHRFHLSLLHRCWPGPLLAVAHEAEELGEILGDHHDIDVLLAALAQDQAGSDVNEAGQRIGVAARRERERLEQAAFISARRLLAEKPRRFGERMRAYWEAASS